ncbi:MAG: hypothetical protein KF870_02645 [Leadbetterella sp.]|nr:hypothetical protein [Leadbetterella sp.]
MKKITVLFSLLLLAAGASAQKMNVVEGDFKFLKDAKAINVVFRYDDMKLFNENKTEQQYIKERSEDLNAKNPGTGDTWVRKWEGAKESIWEPNFMDLIAKTVTAKKGTVFGLGKKDAPYTLTVDAVWIYPGWDAGVMKQPAKVTTLLTFTETGNPSKVLLKIKSENAPGNQWGSNFSNESRIGEGFEKTAKTLGTRIIKEAY